MGRPISRREFLKRTGGLAAAAALIPSARIYYPPHRRLSGSLSILQWSHFVPQHDTWFDPFAKDWGEKNGVTVTVDHINLADIPARATAEINAGEGHDLIEFLYPPAAYEQSVLDLSDLQKEMENRHGKQVELATRSTYNPKTNKFYGFSHGWVPDPGNFRRSMWEKIGMPEGPKTWQELLEGGARIKKEQGVQMGIGMSNELDSNMAARGLIWSFGGSEQDADGNVTINSPETIAAVEYMKQLYEQAMTPEVFSWTAASNNQLLVAGNASWILNSISAYRTAQEVSPEVAEDIFFSAALKGPGGVGLVSEHVIPIYIIPNHAKNPDAAKEFIMHLMANYSEAVYNTQLYTFPSFLDTTPDLLKDGGWLDEDPFKSNPADKLKVLKTAIEWSTVIGHPGPANAAIGEIFGTFLLPQMFARAARGEQTPAESVAQTEKEMIAIFDKWRETGLI